MDPLTVMRVWRRRTSVASAYPFHLCRRLAGIFWDASGVEKPRKQTHQIAALDLGHDPRNALGPSRPPRRPSVSPRRRQEASQT